METIEELTVTYLISRNSKTFERGFIYRLTDKCISCMLYFPKLKAVKVSFPKCFKCFGSYFRDLEIAANICISKKDLNFHDYEQFWGVFFKFQKWNM